MHRAYSGDAGSVPSAIRTATPVADADASLRSEGIEIVAAVSPELAGILTADALRFVARLLRRFSAERSILLKRRTSVQERLRGGHLPIFHPETEWIRSSEWTIAPVPQDLQDRRVEITGPAGDTKLVINALNSGANVFMADFEDAQSPTWDNVIRGQVNLRDAIRRTIAFQGAQGKSYRLDPVCSTLMMRPRGLHLEERHLLVDGKPAPAALFDCALYLYHNAQALIDRGSGPYLYIPKLENHLEARFWDSVLTASEEELGLARGTIKVTVLIETILAAFEMDEILYALRERSAGLNCGRWDYIFSVIKKFSHDPRFVLPDRSLVTMESPFLASYVRLLVQTCHRRGAHAMGGMAANIPSRTNGQEHAAAMKKVRADKEREVAAGHDGTWVAHPDLVSLAREIFDAGMPAPNQIGREITAPPVRARDLLTMPPGPVTESGLRMNIDIGIQYIEAWLRGVGAVPLYHLMEDAATAEISRAQIWQWRRHAVTLEDGTPVTATLIRAIVERELDGLRRKLGEERFEQGQFRLAAALFDHLVTGDTFTEFLTLPAYDYL